MDTTRFWELLSENVSLPFEIANVKEIETNCGSTWIQLQDGSSYFISIEPCEQ
jgi:hypothetical protein